jgi:hypothetical protein
MREFTTGATRDTDEGKLDFEGFLSPTVLQRYAEYMHENRLQADGKLRDSDNWQKGIPMDAYVKSGWRHFFAWWSAWRRGDRAGGVQDACALLFNIMGWLHEELKVGPKPKSSMEKIRDGLDNGLAIAEERDYAEMPCECSIDPMAYAEDYETTMTEPELEWSVTCACGWSGKIDTLILDQVNEACLCPDCHAPLMGLSLEIEVPAPVGPGGPNLSETADYLIELADQYDVPREKLLELFRRRVIKTPEKE